MTETSRVFFAACFLSSFLAFSAELAVVKLLLPHFGASAMVWNACAMVFSGLLVAATAWTRCWVERWGSGRAYQAHLLLLVLSALTFPISARAPAEGAAFLPALGAALLAAIGLPFFALSTATSTLHSRLGVQRADHYALYAASNAGALAALAAYPFLIEPRLSLPAQLKLWYAGFALYGLLALTGLKARGDVAPSTPPPREPGPSAGERLLWILLAAGPVMALLAATSNLSHGMGSTPLLWALPLAIYLSTLVLNYKSVPWDSNGLYACLLALFVLCLVPGLIRLAPSRWIPAERQEAIAGWVIVSGLVTNLMGLFAVCMIAHRSLARAKPAGDASGYYFHVALGGWLGSLAIAALPALARHNGNLALEWLLAVTVIGAAMLWRDSSKLSALWTKATPAARVLAAAILLLAASAAAALVYAAPHGPGVVRALRGYYGIYRVTRSGDMRAFLHGNTIHGFQYTDKHLSRYPLGYYHPHSPLGDILDKLGERFDRVGAVGLGIGSAAAYAKPGQRYDFYELDGDVERIAREDFTHLRDCSAQVRVIIGDARLSLAHSGETYDLLFLDAFSSDAVPAHLLTREAFELYLKRLSGRGLILLHVSSRMVELKPLIAAVAEELGLAGAAANRDSLAEDEFSARYVALSPRPELIARLRKEFGWEPLSSYRDPGVRAWTDDRSSLLDVFFR